MTVTPSQYASAAQGLSDLVQQLQDRMGLFAGEVSEVNDALGVAASLKSSAQGAPQQGAAVLVAKGQALLKILADVQVQTQAILNASAALASRVANPLYDFLNTDPMQWGSRQGELLTALVNDTTTLSTTAESLVDRIQKQVDDVSTFKEEVAQIEQAAAGTGTLPKISALISSTVGTTVGSLAGGLSKALWPIAIVAAVAGVVYLTAPQLFRRSKAS